MSNLLVKPSQPDPNGRVHSVTPASAGWTYVGFEVYRLGAGQNLQQPTGDREACIVMLSGQARVIRPDQVGQETRGKGTNTRHVRNILPETEPAESLLVVEVITPSGHWSSYPPHKHDRDALPDESFLEETYYHRLNPPSGFALQRVYTDDRSLDETLAASD